MREAKQFEVKGTFKEKKQEKKFSKKVTAENQKHAIEKTMSLFGSKNRIKRRNIAITEVKEAKNEQKQAD